MDTAGDEHQVTRGRALAGPEVFGGSTGIVRAVVAWGRALLSALGIGLVVLAGLLVADITVMQPRVDRTIDASAAAAKAHEAMLDRQVGIRGFLLSGDERFLEAYRRGGAALPGAVAEVMRNAPDGGEMVVEWRLAQQAWFDRWAGPVLAGELVLDDRRTVFDLDKELFDEYRVAEAALTRHLEAERDRALRFRSWAIAIAVGGGILTFAVLMAYALRGQRRLVAAVEAPLAEVLARLAAIRAGDYDRRAPILGPSELEAIDAGIADVADALATARTTAEVAEAERNARGAHQAEILRFAREVAGSLSLRYVFRGVCIAASNISGGARVVVWLRPDGESDLVPRADTDGPDLQPLGLEPAVVGEGTVGLAARFGRPHREDPADPGSEPCLALPMVVGARVIGVLEVGGAQLDQADGPALEALETLAVHAATAVDAASLHELTETMAMTDVLTRLPNRRRLEQDLAVEVEASKRYARPLAFMMVDADRFKDYNDEFGHQAGDEALQSLAHGLSDHLRASDTAYRFGGEEFALVLRETGLSEAAHLAERLRAEIAHRFGGPRALRAVTVSIGVAALPEHGPDATSLIAAADAALYEAKRSGRDRVCTAARSGTPG